MNKNHLKGLVLEWTSYSEDVNTEEVFEQLIPPSSLETLHIIGFLGRQYPNWFGNTCLFSLAHVTLRNLRCVDLPPIGQLPNLKFLKIDGAYAVTKVGPEFVGCGKGDPLCNELVAFPKLEWLGLKHLPNWEEWSFFEEKEEAEDADDEGGANGVHEILKDDAQSARLHLFPRLVRLKLEGCLKLRALPRQLGEDTVSLRKLELIRTNNLKAMEDFPHLTELLNIEKCEGLEKVSNLPQVTDLQVRGCELKPCRGVDMDFDQDK